MTIHFNRLLVDDLFIISSTKHFPWQGMFWLTVAPDSYVEQSIVNVSFGKLAKYHSNAMTL